MHQRSGNSDRPPSSDPPYEKRPARSDGQGQPGARPGHPGYHQALLAPTEVLEVKPAACPCAPQDIAATTPYYTQQVIELPEIQMGVTHVVLHKTRCPRCGRLLKVTDPNINN